MAQPRIALAQINPTTGDLAGNAEVMLKHARRAARSGAHLVVFPAMAMTGCPVEGLASRPSFVAGSREAPSELARRLADEGLGDLAVIAGYFDRGGAVALLRGGRVEGRYPERGVRGGGPPSPGTALPVVRVHGVDVGICADQSFGHETPGETQLAAVWEADAGLLAVPAASPYELDGREQRTDRLRRLARDTATTVAYVNMVGGQDELVFDGDSLAASGDGEPIARAPGFRETCLVVDLDVPASEDAGRGAEGRLEGAPETAPDPGTRLAEVYEALVTAVRDYAGKNGFGSALVAASGGIDSALTATLAVDALGAERVHAVLMPSRHSSEHSVTDAEELARRQGIACRTVPVAGMIEAFEKEIEPHGIAAENLQARVRGIVVMTLSNQEGHLVLAAGNASEAAVGYSTLYGDTAGGFAPLSDVPKTMVWQLARWRNQRASEAGHTPPIPEHSITKTPSAELRPGQSDADSLPDYEELDAILDGYLGRGMSYDELVDAGHEPAVVADVVRRVNLGEHKRRQSPLGPRIRRAYGEARLPITHRWREPR